jgi:hypothetical protein
MAARETMFTIKQEFWDMTEKYQRTIRIFKLVLKCGDLVKDARDDQAHLVRDFDAFMRTGLSNILATPDNSLRELSSIYGHLAPPCHG